ncbi:MAG: PIN domain-containing protein [Nitrospiraceae bacterium]
MSGATAITDWILLELMNGLSKSEQPETLLRWFMPVHRLPFEPTWWEKTWNHAASLRKRGFSPGAADCLIATVAMEHRVSLLHCDTDFETIKSVLPLETTDWTLHLNKG